ncbi:hypothetical protein K2X83_01110 [Patescibacteria group bacterium]|nr:hypothetical protein [Patescibacteria group bacterium]
MAKKLGGRFGVHDDTYEVRRHARHVGNRQAARDVHDASYGGGPLAGETGDPFKDDPFFNPWAKGGEFNRET